MQNAGSGLDFPVNHSYANRIGPPQESAGYTTNGTSIVMPSFATTAPGKTARASCTSSGASRV